MDLGRKSVPSARASRAGRARRARSLRRLVSLGVVVGLVGFTAAVANVAFADAPDPILATTNGIVSNGPGGTVRLTLSGAWKWPTHTSNCNLDERAVGFAVDWNDATEPGNLVAGTTDVGVATSIRNPLDNLVHPTPPGVDTSVLANWRGGCGTFSVADGYNSGTWGPIIHDYAAGTTSLDVCVLMYDVHLSSDGGPPKDKKGASEITAGGSTHNKDNSLQSNAGTPLGNGCFSFKAKVTNITTSATSGTSADVIRDTATLTGATAGAGGTITFKAWKDDNTCSGGATFTSTPVAVSGNGTYDSDPIPTPVPAGDYYWIADYSGDAANLGFHTHCGDANERSTVTAPAAPQLTIIKHVVNDDGGTAVAGNWTMDVTPAANPSSNNFAGSEAGVTITLDAGAYSVDESGGPAGYLKTLSAGCSGTIAAGDHKTCTITNDDIAPELTVIKHVINDSGTGTNVAGDFTMAVTGTNVVPASFAGAESPGTVVTLDAGSYSVGETGPGGYAQSSSADCTGTIAVGEKKTCTITNDDIAPAAPQLTIIKHVVNDDGGTAVAGNWTMDVTPAANPSSNNFAGSETGVTITLDPGTYGVDESGGPASYLKTLSAGCSGTIAAGEHKTCTITNNDIAAPTGTIRIDKVLSPSSDPGKFTLQVDGATAGSGGNVGNGGTTGTITVTGGATHSVSETAGTATSLANYDSQIVCRNGTAPPLLPVNGTSTNVSVAGGDAWVCTITNTRKSTPPPSTGSLTVVKDLNPTGDPGKFNLLIDGAPGASNVGDGGSTGGVTVSAGTHVVGESSGTSTALADYTTSISCTDGSSNSGSASLGGVSVPAGGSVTCTITNTRKAPPPVGGIQIDKTGPAMAHVGDTITYSFAVSLVQGSPNVTNVSVGDPICDAGTLTGPTKTGGNQDAVLEQGEVWTYGCKRLVKAGDPDPLPNTVTVSGVDVNGNPVSDDDSHEVDIIHPELTIVKKADPTSGSPGDRIKYTYTVTNSGDVTLYDLSVDDNVLGHVCDIKKLDPGQTVTCTASYIIPENSPPSLHNIAIVGGTDPGGVEVTDRDDATIDIVLGATVTPTKTPPGGVAFTGTSAAISLAGLAMLFLTVGTGLMWAGRRRGRHASLPE